jgi:nucleoside diphosphate kinase
MKGFAFVLIKPIANNNMDLFNLIVKELLNHSSIVALTKFQVTLEKAQEHYIEAKGMAHYAPITTYLADNQLIGFIVEQQCEMKADNWVSSLRTNVIGPSNPTMCLDSHIRHLAIKYNVEFKITLSEAQLPEDQVINGNRTCTDNLLHCSGSRAEAVREIGVWYGTNSKEYKHYTNIMQEFFLNNV